MTQSAIQRINNSNYKTLHTLERPQFRAHLSIRKESRKKEVLLSEDELLNSAKSDHAVSRKGTREISWFEFEDLQGQVKSVTDALNNFEELCRTYLCGDKRLRMSDCDPTAQSTSTVQSTPYVAPSTSNAGQSAFMTAHPVTSVPILTSGSVSSQKPSTSIALQSQTDGISPPLYAPSQDNESFFPTLDTGFNPVYVDPDVQMRVLHFFCCTRR